MYNNPYISNNYNPQPTIDRINAQMSELESMKQQIAQRQSQQPTPTNLTQNFQFAPTNQGLLRYANSIEEVKRDMVIGDTPYFSKDMSVLWVKNNKNEIKTYELHEIIPKDEKDLQIEYLQAQIEELRKGQVTNEQHITDDGGRSYEPTPSKDDATTRTSTKTNKPSSVSRVSKSKSR